MFSRPTVPRAFGSDQDLKRHLYASSQQSYDMSDPSTLYEHGGAAVGPDVVGIGRGASHSYHHSTLSGMEPSVAKLRRVATLAYNRASMDSRDSRSSALPSRWLVLVTAPSIVAEDGHLDTMSASGPAGRESNGTLMPLHNTLFQQLSAIAKEHNFPSTAGLCLYIHYNEKGMAFAPRVTDDSWLVLWRKYLVPDDYMTSPQDFPIVGHVEFDVDVQKAKWYEGWVRAHRKLTAAPRTQTTSISSQPDQWEEEQYQDPPEVLTAKEAAPAPKRLSLLDKRGVGSLSIQAVSRKQSYESSSRTMVEPAPRPAVLPTIVDHRFADASIEPPMPREVNDRIRRWRDESAPASPANFLPGTEPYGFVDLETVEFQYTPHHEPYPAAPTSDDLENDGEPLEIEQELNLDEFTWSISSAGPPIDLSPPTTPRSSVVDEWWLREEDPAMLSPSVIATSWGPPSPLDWPQSPAETPIHSPDLAWRMVEDAPWSPSTRLLSPHPSRILSTHDVEPAEIVEIASAPIPEEVRPVVWPLCEVPTVAAGSSRWAGGGTHLYAQEQRPTTTSQAYGFFDLYHAVYPHLQPYPALACAGRVDPPAAVSLDRPDNLSFGWPYMKATLAVDDLTAVGPATSTPPAKMSQSAMWPRFRDAFAQGWPYTSGPSKVSIAFQPHYPALVVYKPVYPHLEVYPVAPQTQTTPSHSFSSVQYPYFDIYPAVSSKGLSTTARPPVFVASSQYPSFDLYPSVAFSSDIVISLGARYPSLQIYAPVYPHIEPYPVPRPGMVEDKAADLVVSLWSFYPYSAQRVYPAGYPRNLTIYPAIEQYRPRSAQLVQLPSQYPYLRLYAPEYPHFEVYPAVIDVERSIGDVQLVQLPSQYPYLRVYEPQYPYFEVYPAVVDVVRPVAEHPHLKVLIGSKALTNTVVVNQHHHRPRVDGLHRHHSSRSSRDIPPVPPLPADVLAKRKGSPVSPPDVTSSAHVRINGGSAEEKSSRFSVSRRHTVYVPPASTQKKWKHSHLDLHFRVFGVIPQDLRHHGTQTLSPYDVDADPAPVKPSRPLSFQATARGRSGSILGRPPAPPMVPVGRLNLSKYPFA